MRGVAGHQAAGKRAGRGEIRLSRLFGSFFLGGVLCRESSLMEFGLILFGRESSLIVGSRAHGWDPTQKRIQEKRPGCKYAPCENQEASHFKDIYARARAKVLGSEGMNGRGE